MSKLIPALFTFSGVMTAGTLVRPLIPALMCFCPPVLPQHCKCPGQCDLREMQERLCCHREDRQQQRRAVPWAVLRVRPVLPAVPRGALLWGRSLQGGQQALLSPLGSNLTLFFAVRGEEILRTWLPDALCPLLSPVWWALFVSVFLFPCSCCCYYFLSGLFCYHIKAFALIKFRSCHRLVLLTQKQTQKGALVGWISHYSITLWKRSRGDGLLCCIYFSLCVLCSPAGEFIIGRVIKAMNNSWHPDCFCCDICQAVLADVGFVKNAGRYKDVYSYA